MSTPTPGAARHEPPRQAATPAADCAHEGPAAGRSAPLLPESVRRAGFPPPPPLACPTCGAAGTPVGTPGVNGWVYACPGGCRSFTRATRSAADEQAAPRHEPRGEHDRPAMRLIRGGRYEGNLFAELTGTAATQPSTPESPTPLMPPVGVGMATGQRVGEARPCRMCGALIQDIRTERGKLMPCDVGLRVGDGHRTLIDKAGHLHVKAGEDVRGFEPHFGSCPPYQQQRAREAEQKRAAREDAGGGGESS